MSCTNVKINYTYNSTNDINLDFKFVDLNPSKGHVYINIKTNNLLETLKLLKRLCVNYDGLDKINLSEPKELIKKLFEYEEIEYSYGYGNGHDIFSSFKKEDTTFSIYNLFKLRDGGDWNYLSKPLTDEEKINKEITIDVNLHQITEKDIDKLIKILEKIEGNENYFFYNKRDGKHYTLKEIFN